MVLYDVVLTVGEVGISSITPKNGWSDFKEYLIKCYCENCGNVSAEFVPIHRENVIDMGRGRWANLIKECEGCSREGCYTIIPHLRHEAEDKTVICRIQTNGLELVDRAFAFFEEFVAIDLNGNQSDPFEVSLGGIEDVIGVKFITDAPYIRKIRNINVEFRRVNN